mmetsp:Transcript_22871/g.44489  ORF Transcript_22871/g.44489 Transcript_22871/m.44489 type:complete len:379 (+) Transcript_22871:61-1197(+)
MQADAHRSPSGDPGCDGRPLPPVQHFEDFLARAFARIQDELVGEYGRLLADLQDENEDLRRRLEALQDSGGVKPEYDTDDVARISPTAEDFPEQEVDCESEGAERCQKYYDDMGREDGRQSGDAADVSGDGLRDHRKLRAAEGREPHGGGGSRQDRRHDSHHDDQSRSYRNSGGGSSHAGPRSHGGKQHVDINEYSRSDERQESSRRDRYGSRERQGMSHQVMNEPVDYGGLGREQQPEYRKAEVRGRDRSPLPHGRSRNEQKESWRSRNSADDTDRQGGGNGARRTPERGRSRSERRHYCRSVGSATNAGKGNGRQGSREGQLCFLHVLGKCRDENCKARHPDEEECSILYEKLQRTPCRFGASCTRRDCIFRHEKK